MLLSIFILALGLVARVVGAVAPRPPRFPALSLPEPAAAEMFSLPGGSVNSAQPADSTADCWSKRGDFAAETKILPDLREREPPRHSEHAETEDAVGRVET